MTIKTWLDRLPMRLPEDQLNCTLIQVGCMQAEIDELVIKSGMDDAMLAGNAVLISEMRAENTRLSDLCDKWNSEGDELREDNKRLALIIFDHELADYEGEAAELHAQILEQRRVIESMQPRTIGNVGTACGEYVECSGRPDAPHGVDVDASLRAGKTVCLCQRWIRGDAS